MLYRTEGGQRFNIGNQGMPSFPTREHKKFAIELVRKRFECLFFHNRRRQSFEQQFLLLQLIIKLDRLGHIGELCIEQCKFHGFVFRAVHKEPVHLLKQSDILLCR